MSFEFSSQVPTITSHPRIQDPKLKSLINTKKKREKRRKESRRYTVGNVNKVERDIVWLAGERNHKKLGVNGREKMSRLKPLSLGEHIT